MCWVSVAQGPHISSIALTKSTLSYEKNSGEQRFYPERLIPAGANRNDINGNRNI